MPIQLVGKILSHTQPQITYRYITAGKDTLNEATAILESIQHQTTNYSQGESKLIN